MFLHLFNGILFIFAPALLCFELFAVTLKWILIAIFMTVSQASTFFRQRLMGLMDADEITAVWRLVMKHLINYEPVDLVLKADNELPDFMPERLDLIVNRLLRHEPVQYILGYARFHGHEFRVTPATLIPRPETEQLVDMVVDENKGTDLAVLDIGTGSGCIAVSLAMAMKFARVTALDNSEEALAVAAANAKGIKANVHFVKADVLTMQSLGNEPFDVVVSNPPYVCESEKTSIEPNVLNYEPASALFVPDTDPLVFYRAIVRYAVDSLRKGGRIYLEINRRFGKEVATLLNVAGFADVEVRKDSFGNVRFVTATR